MNTRTQYNQITDHLKNDLKRTTGSKATVDYIIEKITTIQESEPLVDEKDEDESGSSSPSQQSSFFTSFISMAEANKMCKSGMGSPVNQRKDL